MRSQPAISALAAVACVAVAWGVAGCYPNFDELLDGPGSAGVDAGSPDTAPPAEGCPEAGVPEGSTYTDLYKDFFGPDGGASCTASSICHVPGGVGATHWVCGSDQASCWTGMTIHLVGSDTNAPEQTVLYQALRKTPTSLGSGPMPRSSTFAFNAADLERIEGWICQGAKND